MNTEHKDDNQAEIWTVGGGKGGTGKTFMVSQLGTCLASLGKKVILVDTDFGGANIHSFFGLKRPPKTLNNFLDKNEPLEDIMIESGIENLSIIPGDFNTINSGSLNYGRKMKLFRHIKKLNADYIIMDLGGGMSNDTMDSFLLGDKMIIVTVPEITAIENLFMFLKGTFFRKLKALLGIYGLKDTIGKIWTERRKHGIHTIVDLLAYVKNSSEHINTVLSKELDSFSIYIVLNKVRNAMEISEGFSIRSICIKHIGLDTNYAGYIEYDFQFWKSLSLTRSISKLNLSFSVQRDLMRITENILNNHQLKISSIKNV
ncbi:MAG: MinD/ParA family protein [bacterium]|nr:MinD/ParA family protein [bacterium]